MPSSCPEAVFDDFVSACNKTRRDRQSERAGGLEIDGQLELGRCLHRQIGRLVAAEDAIEIRRRATPQILNVGAVTG
jgi:hypothetical protein